MIARIVEQLVFTEDPETRAAWYAALFGVAVERYDAGMPFVRVGDQEIGFHPADAKGPTGVAGQVAYWRVERLRSTLRHALELGAILYRGPLDRGDGLHMAQVLDPDGNAIGFFGPMEEITPDAFLPGERP